MKLVIAVVRDDLAGRLAQELSAADLGATKLASTGGFRKAGNSTFLVGVSSDQVDPVLALVRRVCAPAGQGGARAGDPGGATVFVVGMDRLVKV